MKIAFLGAVIVALCASSDAQAGAKISAPTAADNPEMKALYADDQRVRQPGYRGKWNDEPRRVKVRALLAKDALKTGTDFEEAAFVFQHGGTPDDFLLAHTLAMIAMAKGDKSALWIATATLDRYLQQAGKKQIYGTQYQIIPNGQWTREPYDRSLISDGLRRDLGLPTLAQQDAVWEEYSKELMKQLKVQAGK